MARPRKNNVDYFPHDNGMRNDRKIKAVRLRYGIEGYAIYNMLLETLAEEDLLQIKLTDINLDLMAADFAIQKDKLKDIISYFTDAGINLMQSKNGLLQCFQLDKRMKAVFSKRGFSLQKLRESVVSATETGVSGEFLEHPVTETGIVKESKVKESKEETTSPPQKPAADPRVKELIKYFHDGYVAKYSVKPVINGKQDGRLLKTRLQLADVDAIKSMMDTFLTSEDKFIAGLSKTIGTFCAAAVFEKLRGVTKKSKVRLPTPEEEAKMKALQEATQ